MVWLTAWAWSGSFGRMRFIRVLAPLLLTVALTAADGQGVQAGVSQTIPGIDLVVQDPSGNALPKAKVIIVDGKGEQIVNGLTNQWGNFSVSHVPPGAYKVTISLDGFEDLSRTLLVQERTVTELNLVLAAKPVVNRLQYGTSGLFITVVDQSQARIPQASIEVHQVSTGAKLYGQTDSAGIYRIGGLADGSYNVWVRHSGFKQVKLLNSLKLNEDQDVKIVMKVAMGVIVDPWVEPEPLMQPQDSRLDSELLPEPSAIPPAASPELAKPKSRLQKFLSSLRRSFE